MQDNPLGRDTPYRDTYDPGLLFTVPRAEGRASLQLSEPLPFRGVDLWTAYELSWLDSSGRPVVAVMTASVPADSAKLIESKSLKLYLNSFAMTQYESANAVSKSLTDDLSSACGAPVAVKVVTAAAASHDDIVQLPGRTIDRTDVRCDRYALDASLLKVDRKIVQETLHSHLLRSLCPVTGQPDTGSILIDYRGPRIERAALLRYLVSFRQHADFHELCVERIFCDLIAHCGCTELTVYARYNRRGGIDINPYRSNVRDKPQPMRLWRQ
ncbi:MAG: NADPH-dependent 7-cyano-7-deazaguanine reductase QueF [Woeseia sp.]